MDIEINTAEGAIGTMIGDNLVSTRHEGILKTGGFKRCHETGIDSELNVVEESDFRRPNRGTELSAGYDIYNNTGADIVLQPGQTSDKIPTGLCSYMLGDEVLLLDVRSGHGFKYSIRLANTIGVIDADYKHEIFIKLRNPYNTIITIKQGEAFAQGIFMKYLKADDDAETVGGKRVGGLGSTSK